MGVTPTGLDGDGGAGPDGSGNGLTEVRAPLPGTFYRAPRPGAEPFVEVGSRVGEDTVVGIVETMKLFNPVHAGTRGRVAEICVGDAEFTPGGGALMRVRAEP
jgi:acetyl-CoA carboxylase biotin carboxyl carrier protein